MKTLLTAYAVGILCAFSLSADEVSSTIAQLEADEAAVMAEAESRFRLRTDVIQTETTDEWIYIPSAGSLQGGFGTFYKSDISISNHRNVSQRIQARWIPMGGSGLATEAVIFTVPSRGFVTYEDFVASVLGYEGLGAIEFTARTTGGEIDRDAELDIYSRIWTPQPGTSLGTVSQNFDGVSFSHTINAGRLQAVGLKQNLTYRTNVGILNLDSGAAQTFTVRIEEPTGDVEDVQITVPAYSMIQQGIPSRLRGDLRITFMPPEGLTSRWVAYATTSDNGTGDGWVAIASKTRP